MGTAESSLPKEEFNLDPAFDSKDSKESDIDNPSTIEPPISQGPENKPNKSTKKKSKNKKPTAVNPTKYPKGTHLVACQLHIIKYVFVYIDHTYINAVLCLSNLKVHTCIQNTGARVTVTSPVARRICKFWNPLSNSSNSSMLLGPYSDDDYIKISLQTICLGCICTHGTILREHKPNKANNTTDSKTISKTKQKNAVCSTGSDPMKTDSSADILWEVTYNFPPFLHYIYLLQT